LANNFQSFISKFEQTNFDFQMAVTTTDAWIAPYHGSAFLNGVSGTNKDVFRDGTNATGHTGIKIITPNTPNLEQTFITNAVQGINGFYDERGLQSMEQALINTTNRASFPRQGSILAVILLTDENDYSHPGTEWLQEQGPADSIASLTSVQHYHDFLSQLSGSTGTNKRYIFNTIGIVDEACRNQLNQGQTWQGRQIVTRYMALSDMSGGVKGSICNDFSGILSGISDAILELSTRFVLNRKPLLSSVVVKVNGAVIPQDNANGWSYDEANNAINFHGSAIPARGVSISITFDPLGSK
jgi:hypothetical protein